MPNVGDIIRAADFSGAGIKAGAVVPFYNVTLSGRYPIFWGESEADTNWLVCDGGSDLHGGNVPDLRNKFVMGCISVDEANKTGGSATTSSSTIGGNVGSTTLTTSTMPSHTHNISYIKQMALVEGLTVVYSYINIVRQYQECLVLLQEVVVRVHIHIAYLRLHTLTH